MYRFSSEKLGHHRCESCGIRAGVEAVLWDERKTVPSWVHYTPIWGKREGCRNIRTGGDEGGIQVRRRQFATRRVILTHSLPIAKTVGFRFSPPAVILLCVSGRGSGRKGKPNLRRLYRRNMPVWWPATNRNVCAMHDHIHAQVSQMFGLWSSCFIYPDKGIKKKKS